MIMKDFGFNVFGEKYKVSFKDKVEFEDHDFTWGISDVVYKTLEIARNLPNGEPLDKDEISRTVLHELIHIILDEGMYMEESRNEALVEWLAKCLYDILVRQRIIEKI